MPPTHIPLVKKLKYNADLEKIVVDTLVAGGTISMAARRAGLPASKLRSWLEKGEEGRKYSDVYTKSCARLYRAVHKAIADAEVRNLLNVQKAGDADWKASSWWLERAHPNRWNYHRKAAKNDHNTKPAGPTLTDFVTPNPALDSAGWPQGARPPRPSGDEIQNSPGGSTLGQDGSVQTQADPGAVGGGEGA